MLVIDGILVVPRFLWPRPSLLAVSVAVCRLVKGKERKGKAAYGSNRGMGIGITISTLAKPGGTNLNLIICDVCWGMK